jgi:hypothetical protein
MISAQTRSAFVARENRFTLFRIMRYRLPEVASFEGAVSGMNIMAQSPAAVANSKYQAGASALPVTSVSQATTSWAVPPKIAIATA